jgi:hypothetical protein
MKNRLKVYVAGPMTVGDTQKNIGNGIRVGEKIFKKGLVPFIPHLSHFWGMWFDHTWDEWLSYDEEWLKCCDAMYVIPGDSPGREREEEFCKENNIPVFYDLDDLFDWCKDK